jgi:hypothetical protein
VSLYNISRHPDAEKLPPDHLHAVWIRNEGIYGQGDTSSSHLTFDELRTIIIEFGQVAESMSEGTIFNRPDPG